MSLVKIISGGQTGADQGGLQAAKILGLETGGWAPKGYKTELGPNLELKTLYGLRETVSPQYPPRTRMNVANSNGTLIFGRLYEPGSKLTISICEELGKPYLALEWPKVTSISQELEWEAATYSLMRFVLCHNIKTLNVAGNRESKFVGINYLTEKLIVDAFKGKN